MSRTEVARPKRFELLTPRFVVWCSIQLSYGRRVRRVQNTDQRSGRRCAPIAIGFAAEWQGGANARTRTLAKISQTRRCPRLFRVVSKWATRNGFDGFVLT